MRARTAIAGARPGGRLTAAGCAALAILATTTACSTPSGAAAAGSTPASGTPTDSFVTARAPSSRPSAGASAGASASPSPVPVQPAPFASATQSASPVPVGAPSTGGGGTAGVQDILLFGLGGAALLAGAGSLAYRRRNLRDR